MHNYKAIIAYDGAEFFGWQKSPGFRTVEETLEEVLKKKLQHPLILQAASRTDAGVHAAGQVINFFSPIELDGNKFCLGVNKLLPGDLRMIDCSLAPSDFHPSLSCVGKEYRYKVQTGIHQNPLLRRHAWHVYYPLDLAIVRQSALKLLGTHDFKGFVNTRPSDPVDPDNTIRTLHAVEIFETETHLEIRVMGDHFLYKMVRNIVGTLIDIGTGKLPSNTIEKLLCEKKRTEGGITAPAHGLTLQRLIYSPP